MRAFIAVELAEDLKRKAEKLQERIDMLDIDVTLVRPENMHYILKFLGEINEEDVEKVKQVMDKVGERFGPFELHATGLGAFPSNQYVRVIWVGAKEGSQHLRALAEQLELELSGLGFRKETKQYTPHLTLGRVKSARNKPELLILLRELENAELGSFRVEEIKLFKSVLSPKGPIYTVIHTAKLKGGANEG